MHFTEKQTDDPIYCIMSDQPDCCGKCGSRVDLLEIKAVNGERVCVTECLGCHHKFPSLRNKGAANYAKRLPEQLHIGAP